jgi:transcriptional regulator with XRE-family HTH domain
MMTDGKEKEFAAEFAARLIAKREALGKTKTQLADAIGSSTSQVSRWEAGNQLPRINWLVRLAHALGCELGELAPGIEALTETTETEDPEDHDGIYEEHGTPAGA